MTSPDADRPHDIADTGMFRRFVEEAPKVDPPSPTGLARLWVWPGLLIPVIGSIVVVGIVLALLTR